MFKIKLIVLGKFKEKYWQEAENEYLKRLNPYAKIEITEIPEEPFRESDDRDMIKKKEAEKILKHLPDNCISIALHENAKSYTSKDFANFLDQKSSHGEELVFIIGGPLGLDQSVLNKTQFQTSLSDLTFPHQMVRVILFEQIYRAATIINGKRYHY